MRTVFAISVAGAMLLFGAAGPAPNDPSAFQALFCPEYWDYLEVPVGVDERGNYAICVKYPVEFEAQQMKSWWCGRERKWRHAPCSVNWMKRCCTGEESLAAVAPLGRDVFQPWYCPSHRAFDVYRLPVLSQWICQTCAKPAVKVDVIERPWYWCETDGVWTTQPCPMNPMMKCCSKRGGALLVKLDAGPLAK